MRRTVAVGWLALVALVTAALPAGPIQPVRAVEGYTLATVATYDVQPASRRIDVTVAVTFTNTTPDPSGQFSAFDEIKLAIHDQAAEVAASDADGDLEVSVAVEEEVNVATVGLRDQLRHEEVAELELTYSLPNTEDLQLRVRPSMVVFAAWSFGTSGEVRVNLPAGYEVRLDGDPLSESGGSLVSGPIADPSQWLSLVTAVRDPEYTSVETTVPLAGGTADLRVRAFADDEPWGDRTLALSERALALLEEEIGLPYPRLGQLVLTETVAINVGGFGESGSGGAAILIAFDQPPFTTLHQVAHVWLSEDLIAARWIREGMASDVAARIAPAVEVEVPYDPAAVAAEQAAARFPLDAWSADAGRAGEAFGYAGSWSVIAELRSRLGDEALRTVLARVAASVGPYHSADITPGPGVVKDAMSPTIPLSSRSFLDHLETVTGADVTDLFRAHVFTEADVALLEPRAAARAAFNELVEAANGWGAPDPVAGAMTAWSFEDAMTQIDAARAWLVDRETLLAEMRAAGLSAPERLQEAYRANGGGAEARSELERERAVVEAYAATAAEVNEERSFIERIGLIGGPDPSQKLAMANGRFADGDLSGAVEAIGEVQRVLAAAEPGGLARLASVALIAVVLLVLAAFLFRRRGAAPTAA